MFGPPGQMLPSTRATGLEAPIPLAPKVLLRLTVLSAIRTVAIATAVPCWLIYTFVPGAPRSLHGIALLLGVIAGTAVTWLWITRPQGSVHRMPSGERWLFLVKAHPRFIEALNRSRIAPESCFSRDRKWYWDGGSWVSNELPDERWGTFLGGLDTPGLWQVRVGIVISWVLIGALAWWSSNR